MSKKTFDTNSLKNILLGFFGGIAIIFAIAWFSSWKETAFLKRQIETNENTIAELETQHKEQQKNFQTTISQIEQQTSQLQEKIVSHEKQLEQTQAKVIDSLNDDRQRFTSLATSLYKENSELEVQFQKAQNMVDSIWTRIKELELQKALQIQTEFRQKLPTPADPTTSATTPPPPPRPLDDENAEQEEEVETTTQRRSAITDETPVSTKLPSSSTKRKSFFGR